MIGDLDNGIGDVDDDIQKVIDRLLIPSSESKSEPATSPSQSNWQNLLEENQGAEYAFKASPLDTPISDVVKPFDHEEDEIASTAVEANQPNVSNSLVCDPIRGILTGENDAAHYDPNLVWLNGWSWPHADSSYICDPFVASRFAEPSAERVVAASLAFLATKIVGSSLPKDTQEALISSPPSSLAEARSLMSLLQSQPRRRGRPRKNPCFPQQLQEKRPRGRPRKKPLEIGTTDVGRQRRLRRLSRLRSLRSGEKSTSPEVTPLNVETETNTPRENETI
eukprot:Gregarina_sp_Poly_1__970@NODE_1236_length_4689_cov_699_025314_g842_i0_p2_GENE_NODE_1236_length_4689_cov_699_025314_g842_i0NODE_1236_length_4689_cov_699_025314_g842_i0_p2_ORF_typecomplete_len280_score52_04AT_hook/PF02178_19/8_3AT_hook/PF02178_19/16_NODE_1236_length_4689_cov_699_025314_g842_i036824521